jgi:hypothetical protein
LDMVLKVRRLVTELSGVSALQVPPSFTPGA